MQGKTINLGNQLVALLSNNERADTFSRWVAHYIAEQMVLAESAKGPERAIAEERCFQAILNLWSHRRSLPNGLRPFEEFEPILRALACLDPDEPRSAYHSLLRSHEMGGEPAEVQQLADFVISLDRVTRSLMEFALSEASAKAVNAETKLLLENALPSSMTNDLDAVRKLVQLHEREESGGNLQNAVLKRKWERLMELEKFGSYCDAVAAVLKTELEAAESEQKRAGAKAEG